MLTLAKQLRRVRLAVERRWTDSVVPLLYTWAEPTLSLRHALFEVTNISFSTSTNNDRTMLMRTNY